MSNKVKFSLGMNNKELKPNSSDRLRNSKRHYFAYKITSNINEELIAYSICFIVYFAVPWDWIKWKMK